MNRCGPGTHFYTAGRCTFCGQAPAPVPPRPRCPKCAGTGVASLTWLGPPGGDITRWHMDDCTACAGTGKPT